MGAISLSAQDLKNMAATADAMSSNSMIDQLADSQIKSLAKKFNFSDAQAEKASAVVKEVMKSPKFQSMMAEYSPDKLLAGSGTDMIQNALLGDKSFLKGMKGIASKDQMSMMKKAASTLE